MRNNKRNEKRRHLIYYLQAIDAETGQELGRVGDISTNGLLLLTEANLPMGEFFNVIIKIHGMKEEGSVSQIQVRLKTLWSKKDYNPSISCIGTQFVEPTEEDIEAISNIIDSIGFFNGEPMISQMQG